MEESLAVEKGKNGRDIFTEKLADEIVAACGSGFTLEKAGALVGVNPSTIRTWAQRKPDFARRVETSRKKHELSLLRDIEIAGAKSWQAKAWMAERIYNHAVPSARLAVTQEHTHGISSNLAGLLAGIAIRKRNTLTPKTDPPKIAGESERKYIDIQSVRQTTESETSDHMSHNKQYINFDSTQENPKKLPKPKNKRMRLRKPRAESLAKYTTTPPATPPAPA
jgi:hypothetical protein